MEPLFKRDRHTELYIVCHMVLSTGKKKLDKRWEGMCLCGAGVENLSCVVQENILIKVTFEQRTEESRMSDVDMY